MRILYSILTVSLMIILAGQIAAQGYYPLNLRIEKSQGAWPEDIIKMGKPFTINVYFENPNDECIYGFYFMPGFYGQEGVTEVVQLPTSSGTSYFTNVGLHNGIETWWNLMTIIDPLSWDGYLPDTFYFAGLSLPCSWPSGQGEILCFSFDFMINDTGIFRVEDAYDYGIWEWDFDPLYQMNYFDQWPVVDTSICGDVYDDGAVNILDVLFIIWCVYLNPDPGFECNPEEWDFDNDGTTTILDIVYLIQYLYMGGPEPVCGWMSAPGGTMTGHTGCLESDVNKDGGVLQYTDCVAYDYDGEGTLLLTHLYADFNCCFDSLTASLTVEDNVITINEYEHPPGGYCDCVCDYNIDFEINNLSPGAYALLIYSDYLLQYGGYINFALDLINNPSDTLCVE